MTSATELARHVPVIDISGLVSGERPEEAARAIVEACRVHGFFYVVGHGVDPALEQRLEVAARTFFSLPETAKRAIRMELGGRAWRGWFPVGGELTSGEPDLKEGLYFGAEHADDHPRVVTATPLHGRNLFPAEVPELRGAVLAWVDAMTRLGTTLLSAIARGLGLDPAWFRDHWTDEPTTLFRVFHYPPHPLADVRQWGVGEHTDYGVLTILKQDDAGGLEVKSRGQWIGAPPVPGSFVCNIGDMLERMTSGEFVSTPHRVRNLSGRSRLSYPFFFDPGFDDDAGPLPIVLTPGIGGKSARWDGRDVHAFKGTYGEYLMEKVSKVFPDLFREFV